MGSKSPELSVVVIADSADSLEELVRRLAAQHPAIELVAVSEQASLTNLVARAASPSVVVVEVDSLSPVGAARAAGVEAATAPIVALGELHGLPCDGWAEAVLAAHGRGADCVVPRLVDANQRRPVSSAAFVLAYGPYSEATVATNPRRLPVYNCSWRRSRLTSLGDVGRLLVPGSPLGQRLALAGGRVAFAGDARIEHRNATRLWVLLTERFHLGRVIGGGRADSWRWPRRAAYLVASPMVAVVVLRRALSGVRPRELSPTTLVIMLLAAAVQSVGEAVGYAAGGGSSDERLTAYELARDGAPS